MVRRFASRSGPPLKILYEKECAVMQLTKAVLAYASRMPGFSIERLAHDIKPDFFWRDCYLLGLKEAEIRILFDLQEEYGMKISTVLYFLKRDWSLPEISRAVAMREVLFESGDNISLRMLLQYDRQYGDGLPPQTVVRRLQDCCARMDRHISEVIKFVESVEGAIYPETAIDTLIDSGIFYRDDYPNAEADE